MESHMLTDEQVAKKTKRVSEALLFLARNYGDGMARRQYHEISEALHERDALLADRAELVAKNEWLEATLAATRERLAGRKAEVERLNATIWESLFCGETAPGKCDVRTCKGRWLCSRMTEGWTPKENTDD